MTIKIWVIQDRLFFIEGTAIFFIMSEKTNCSVEVYVTFLKRMSLNQTKYLFSVGTSTVFYLCGLYKIVDGKYRFVILTRAANETMIEIHERMPIIVTEPEVRPYLTDPAAAEGIIATAAPMLSRQEA